jgi:hypothetical protein
MGRRLFGVTVFATVHQQSCAPEVQTTGDTTPAQQIVWAESLTTSGGSNRWGLTELRQ